MPKDLSCWCENCKVCKLQSAFHTYRSYNMFIYVPIMYSECSVRMNLNKQTRKATKRNIQGKFPNLFLSTTCCVKNLPKFLSKIFDMDLSLRIQHQQPAHKKIKFSSFFQISVNIGLKCQLVQSSPTFTTSRTKFLKCRILTTLFFTSFYCYSIEVSVHNL